VGPKKALQGFAEDVLGERGDVVALFTNHPKVGDIPAFNQALCCLYAAGLGRGTPEAARQTVPASVPAVSALPKIPQPIGLTAPAAVPATAPVAAINSGHYNDAQSNDGQYNDLGRLLGDVLERGWEITHGQRRAPIDAAVAITGAALGLPGTEHIFDDGNIGRILRGDP